jgi:23S rRNA (uracil1939-C5)-methyltransferase
MDGTVHIEKIIAGGYGLGRRQDGMVVLTRYVLPGETIRYREIRKRRGHIEAETVEVLDLSPDRVTPRCPFYTVCGGCDFQHISLGAQLRIKEEIIAESLLRAGTGFSPSRLQQILPSPATWQYRRRLRLKLSPAGAFGFCKPASNEVAPVDQCPVATAPLNRALLEISRSPLLSGLAASAREIDLLHSPADDQVFVRLQPRPGKTITASLVTALAGSLHSVDNIGIQHRDNRRRDLLRQDFASDLAGRPFSLTWTPSCFFQVNAEQNTRLIRLVLSLTGPAAGKRVLDLFCGMGNFSVPLAIAGAQVTGVEWNRESISRAGINAATAGAAQTVFAAGDVLSAVRRFMQQASAFDLILLDPPRTGLGRESGLLPDLAPGKIIYVSCDPATLARDIAILAARGYKASSVTPVDMFPQTHHIESVALLEKN